MRVANISVLSVAKYFVSFSVFLFLTLSVSFKGSYGVSGAFIILSYLFFFSREVREQVSLSKIEKGLVWVLLAFLLSMILEVVCYSIPISDIDPESKILLFIPLIYLLNAVKIQPIIIIAGIGCGAFGVFLLAVYERYVLEMERVGSFINAIQLGNVALVLGLLSLLMAVYTRKRSSCPKVISLMLVFTGVCGVIASLATLTRGGLVFLPLVVLIVGCYFINEIKRFKKQLIVTLVAVITALFLLLSGSEFMSRVQGAIDSVESYFETGEASTSSGLRLELWKAAVLITKENPVFGVGASQYIELKSELIEQGQLNPSILNYGHSHNAYLYALVRRGSVGLIFLLVLLAYPIVIAHKELRKTNSDSVIPAVSLLVFGLFFVFANLTQVFFAHNSGMIMYTGLLIILVNFNLLLQMTSRKTAVNSNLQVV